MLILTVNDIFERIYLQLRENGADPVHWSDNELFKYLNDMLLDIAENAKIFKISKTIRVVSGKRRYRVPEEILVPTRLEYDGEYLDPASVEDLDEADKEWRERTGDVLVWYVELAPAGYIDVYKVPDTNGDETSMNQDYGIVTDVSDGSNTYTFSSDYGVVTGVSSDDSEVFELDEDKGLVTDWASNVNNLVIHGAGYPAPLTNFSDTLPRPIHGAYQVAVDYCTYRAFLKDSPGYDVEKAEIFRQGYLQWRNNIRTKPKTATRRRFVRRMQDFELVRVIGPRVPSKIE